MTKTRDLRPKRLVVYRDTRGKHAAWKATLPIGLTVTEHRKLDIDHLDPLDDAKAAAIALWTAHGVTPLVWDDVAETAARATYRVGEAA